jgi:hypothetical protein
VFASASHIAQCRAAKRAALEMEYTYESNRIESNTLILQETAMEVKWWQSKSKTLT